jgi:hypothetical protein
VETGDLTSPVAILSKTTSETCYDQAGVIDRLARSNEVSARGNLFNMAFQAEQSTHFVVGQNRA